MAVYADRVKETTTTTGTGTYSLAGAQSGFQTFIAGAGNGSVVTYACDDGTNWEVGEGTLTSGAPSTLTRTTILSSSNAGAAVSWAAGTKNIYLTVAASRLVTADASGNLRVVGTSTLGAASTNYLTVSGAGTGANVGLAATGETTTGLNITVPGTGGIAFLSNGTTTQFKVLNTSGASNFLYVTGGVAGTKAVTLGAFGSSDANVDVNVVTQGTGQLKVNGTAVPTLAQIQAATLSF